MGGSEEGAAFQCHPQGSLVLVFSRLKPSQVFLILGEKALQ